MGEYALEPNTVYDFDENGTPRNPNDSQSLINPEQSQEAAIPQNMFMDVPIIEQRPDNIQPESIQPKQPAPAIITNRPELRDQAIDTGGGYVGKDEGVISYKDSRKGDTLRKPDPVEQQLEKIEKLTPEQLTTIFEGKYKVSLTKSAEEQALEQVRSEAPQAFRKRFGYDISRATSSDLSAFLTDRDKVTKGLTKIFSERQRLAIEERKEYSADEIRKTREELSLLKKMIPTPKNTNYYTPEGRAVIVDMNSPHAQKIIDVNNLTSTSPKAGSDVAKIGLLRAVGLDLASKYLPLAIENTPDKGKELTAGLFTTDQFGQSVNEARLRNSLTPKQREGYDRIKIDAETLAKTHSPAKAVEIALTNYHARFPKGTFPSTETPKDKLNPNPTEKKATGQTMPPTGYYDSKRTSGGKKVYVSPDGKNAWIAP